jgi:hypothetical protein
MEMGGAVLDFVDEYVNAVRLTVGHDLQSFHRKFSQFLIGTIITNEAIKYKQILQE